MTRFTDEEFARLVAHVESHYGIDLSKKRTLAECRLRLELDRLQIPSLGAFLDRVEADRTGQLATAMMNRLTTNYTFFLRERSHFDFLTREILPRLTSDAKSFQIWCAGCSTGEECYTLAMLLSDYEQSGKILPYYEILGTDASDAVVKAAQEARYSARELSDIPPTWQSRYIKIQDEGKSFTVVPEIRRHCKFRQMNLLAPTSTTRLFDIIFCRNVMIYFSEEARGKLVDLLYRALKPGGYLFVGHTELLAWNSTMFQYVCPAVYRK